MTADRGRSIRLERFFFDAYALVCMNLPMKKVKNVPLSLDIYAQFVYDSGRKGAVFDKRRVSGAIATAFVINVLANDCKATFFPSDDDRDAAAKRAARRLIITNKERTP